MYHHWRCASRMQDDYEQLLSRMGISSAHVCTSAAIAVTCCYSSSCIDDDGYINVALPREVKRNRLQCRLDDKNAGPDKKGTAQPQVSVHLRKVGHDVTKSVQLRK